MIYRNLNVPLGVPIVGTPFKNNPIGAFAAAGASLLGNLISGSQQQANTKENMRLQSKLNKEEMLYSNSLQRDQQEWLMNTQYGKMTSGMKNAGLNPATANGTTPSVPSASSPATGPSGPSAPFVDYGAGVMNALNTEADLDIKEAQVENIEADTAKKEQETASTEQDVTTKKFDNRPRMLELRERGLETKVLLDWENVQLTEQERYKCMSEIQKICKDMDLTDAQINEIETLAAKYKQDIEESKARIDLMGMQKVVMRSQAAANYASAYNSYASGREANERVNSGLYKQEAKSYETQATLNNQQIENLKKKGYTEQQIAEYEKHMARQAKFDADVKECIGVGHEAGTKTARDIQNILTFGAFEGSNAYRNISTGKAFNKYYR